MVATLEVLMETRGTPYEDAFGTAIVVHPIKGQRAFFNIDGGFGREPRIWTGSEWVQDPEFSDPGL
jgi:hypothetical protein